MSNTAFSPKTLIVLLAAAFLAACNQTEFYSDLSEHQANEMVSVLRSDGIDARKKKGRENYVVSIPDNSFVHAYDTLTRAGLPRRRYQTVDKVFEKPGLIPQAFVQQKRYVAGKQEEIEKTLEAIEGVVAADVLINIPTNDEFYKDPEPSSVSVVVHHYEDHDISSLREGLKPLIANSIESMTREKISIEFFPRSRIESQPSAAGISAGTPNKASFTLVLGALALLAGGAGYAGWQVFAARRRNQSVGQKQLEQPKAQALQE